MPEWLCTAWPVRPCNFIVHTFSEVAVAVIVFQRALHADVLHGCRVGGAGMAGDALVILELQRVRVMTGDAGVIAFHVGKLGIIGLAVILVADPGLCAVLDACCCQIVDVSERMRRHLLHRGLCHRCSASNVGIHAVG